MASTHRHGILSAPSGRETSSSTSASRCSQIALTWSLERRSTPIAAATFCTFLVLVPVAYISLTAATIALSTLW